MTDLYLKGGPPSLSQNTDFEALINAIPAVIARMDCNLQIIYANTRFFRHFPCSNGATDFFHKAVGASVFNQVQRHLGQVLSGTGAQFTLSVETQEGIRYMDINLSPQFDDLHRVSSIIFHGMDSTQRLNDQRALHDYFENATIGLHWVNADGIIIWANPAELKMLGYEQHEYTGQHISRFHKDQNCIADILTRLKRGEVLRNFEAEMVCKNGTTKYVSINSSVLWEGDKFIHTRCFTIDITARKHAAEAVRESDQRFRIMADLVPLVIWTTDENGMFTFLSSQWKGLTGKNVEAGIGRQWLDSVHPEDQANIATSWTRALAKRSAFEAKFRMLNGKGGHTVCYVNSLPRFDSNNNFLGYTGFMQDFSTQEQITASLEKMVMDRTNDLRLKNIELVKADRALKIKNDELAEINNELSSFAHVASHDLQEPLRKIQTFTDRVMQLDGDKLSQQGLRFMAKIENASTRMRGLIQDILQYSKADNEQTNTEPVDLNVLVRDVITEFEVKIEEKKAVVECAADLPIVQVTRFQFHQLFLNLISNALKFSKPHHRPHIRITWSVVNHNEAGLNGFDEYYLIAVADNGIGFNAEYSSQIFEMFNRLHNGRQFEGTGIGLAICKKIVERHGGRVIAEGQAGIGATFKIYLPAHRIHKKNTTQIPNNLKYGSS